MRILIVTQYFHPENFVVNRMVEALQEAGHEPVVLTGQPSYPTRAQYAGHDGPRWGWERYRGVEVLRVPMLSRGRGRSWQLALNYLSFAASATLLGLPRLRGRFDASIAWCISPMTAAIPGIVHRAFRRTPAVTWVQDLWPETVVAVTGTRNPVVLGGLRRLVRWIYRHSDGVWIQSPAYRPSVLAHGGRPEQVDYVPNWADDLYDSARWDDVEPDDLPPNALVFAGNLGRAQGLETMVEAATLVRDTVPEARWVFVGDGTLRDWLAGEIVRRGLEDRVTLLPRRPASAMPALLKASAAALVSLADDPVFAQTIPSKVQSVLAAGRPVVGALAGEAARVIREAGAGLVCPPEDPRALAGIVGELFSMPPAEREQLGRRGHAYYAAHFTEAGVIAAIDRLLASLTAPRRP